MASPVYKCFAGFGWDEQHAPKDKVYVCNLMQGEVYDFGYECVCICIDDDMVLFWDREKMITMIPRNKITSIELVDIPEEKKENENMITLKELLSCLKSDAYIVDIDNAYAVSGDPNKLKTILVDNKLKKDLLVFNNNKK